MTNGCAFPSLPGNASVTGNATFCRQFGVFTADHWRGPYRFARMIEVFGEDPYLFSTAHGIHMIADLRQYTPAAGPVFAPGNQIHTAHSADGCVVTTCAPQAPQAPGVVMCATKNE